MEKRLDKIEKAMFTGNGKPPFTVRMTVIENKLDDLSKIVQKTDNNVEKLTKFMITEKTEKETKSKIDEKKRQKDEKKLKILRLWLVFISGVVIGLAGLFINH